MKVFKFSISIIFIFTSILFSQPFKSDFKINQDNQPSTITQLDPKIFINNSNQFIITWIDYRKGEEKIYAQRYDGNGNKIGNNFLIDGNEDIIFINDTTFIVISYYLEDLIYAKGANFQGRIYNQTNPIGNSFFLGSALIPEECQSGWSGYFSTFLFHQNKFMAFISNDGRVTRTTINLPFSERIVDTIITDRKAIKIMAEKLVTNDYALFWIRDSSWKNFEGFYANFYNSDGQILAVKKILSYEGYIFPSYKVTSLNDSVYYVYFIDPNSKQLNIIKLDRIGNLIEPINQISIPVFSFLNFYSFSDVFISNLKDGKFYLSFYLSSYINDRNFVANYLYEFNQSGNFTGNYWIDTTLQLDLTFEKSFFNLGNQNFLTGYYRNYDIYKIKLHQFNPIIIEKANDDLVGSNEVVAMLSQKSADNYFVYYADEVGWRGRFISSEGNILSEEKRVDVSNIKFFNNGDAISLWVKKLQYPSAYAGFVYFDENLNKIKVDTLKLNGNPINIYDELISFQILDNSNVLIVYRSENLNYARLQTKNGDFVKEILLGSANYSFPKIFKHSENVYILNFSNQIQLFDQDLNPLSQVYSGNIEIYFGNYKYLSRWRSSYGYPPIFKEYGVIKTISGDSLKSIYFGEGIYSLKIFPVNENYFMTTYEEYQLQPDFSFIKNFFVKTYTTDGRVARGPIQINENVPSNRKNLVAYHINNKVYFFWADTRDGNYDIYSSIFNRGTLTEIEEEQTNVFEFQLEQNYPNPFNSTTLIKYSIKDEGKVTLKIFDLLGREVATLVDENKKPGNYELKFTANNLASGIYIYQLRQGDRSLSKKLVLLK
jgi:hypothetical protein